MVWIEDPSSKKATMNGYKTPESEESEFWKSRTGKVLVGLAIVIAAGWFVLQYIQATPHAASESVVSHQSKP